MLDSGDGTINKNRRCRAPPAELGGRLSFFWTAKIYENNVIDVKKFFRVKEEKSEIVFTSYTNFVFDPKFTPYSSVSLMWYNICSHVAPGIICDI